MVEGVLYVVGCGECVVVDLEDVEVVYVWYVLEFGEDVFG